MDIRGILEDQNPWWREPGARGALSQPVRRDLQPKVLERVLRTEDRRAALILGPRQVGKTVLLRQLADDLLDRGLPPANLTYFDFSDDRVTGSLSPRQVVEAKPVGFVEGAERVLLLDEIRLAEQWDRWLKQAVDHRVARLVATDSAASLLRDGARESGQGRWDELQLEGLTFREFVRLHGGRGESAEDLLARQPDLPEIYLAVGGFPEHARNDDFPEVRRRLRADIVERAILRDLGDRVDDPLKVRDLFVYLAQGSGAIWNARDRASDLGADPRTVRSWLELLLDTFLLRRLDPSVVKASARLRPRPKVYAADHGLVAAFAVSPTRDESVRARVFEAVVFRHLRQIAEEGGRDLFYFRQGERLEVDFVLEGGGERVGIEVTASARPPARKLQKLRRAGGKLAADRLVLIHGGLVEETVDEVSAVPLGRFLLDPGGTTLGGGR